MSRHGKVVVAMSGGVDSSVAAALLRDAGYDCVGVLMRNGIEPPAPPPGEAACRARTCCSASDAQDARRVADRLGIPFYVLDFEREFTAIINYFVAEYDRGRTPNPCVMCNQHLKFGKLFAYAAAVDAEFVATGHYARVEPRPIWPSPPPAGPLDSPAGTEPALLRGCDTDKDQSYALFGVRRDFLTRMRLPVGGFTKPEIRALARDLALVTADKPDSQEICFVPDNDHVGLLRDRLGQRLRPGDVRDTAGRVLGRHAGFQTVTIGQRKGLALPLGRPMYVVATDPATNTVVMGSRDELACRACQVQRFNWLVTPPPTPAAVHAQIRYNHRGSPATVVCQGSPANVAITFDPPESAVTPGQAAVVYDGDRVLGGGWIDSTQLAASPVPV